MKDLFEIRFESKVVIGSDKLPKGMTEPLSRLVETLMPVVEKAVKEYLNGNEEPDDEKQTSKE